MIKIKFSMDFHGEYIRNLEGLRKNFSVEDVLEVYDNGVLVKWLDARLYTNELKEVQAIEAKNARGVLEELIRIFSPDTEQEEIDENLALYDYLEERRKYREYVMANGLDELNALRKENEKLRLELETVRKERDALRQNNDNDLIAAIEALNEVEALKKENEHLKQSTTPSSLIEAKIPAGRGGIWQAIREIGTSCIIKNIGNCNNTVYIRGKGIGYDVSIGEAIKKKIRFNGLAACVIDTGKAHGDLYFYYEVV